MELDPTTILSPTAVVLIIGLTQLVRSFATKGGKPVPEWLIAIPSALGLLVGIATTMTEAAPETTTIRLVGQIIMSGLAYAGASVLLYELYSRTIGPKAAERKAGPPQP